MLGVQAWPQSIQGSMYTLARSMRLFPTALSPHSLTSPAPLYAGLRYEASSGEPVLPTSSPSPSHASLARRSVDEEEVDGVPGRPHHSQGDGPER